MTEREKQLAGMLYCHDDEEIGNAFMRCSKLVYEFNTTAYNDEESRQRIIRKMLNARGKFHIEHGFICVFGTNVTIGNNFYANYNVQLLDPNTIEIGDDVLIAPNVVITTAGHPTDPALRRQGLEYAKPIKIGNGVWLGAGAVVLPGVTIGDHSIIGAGAVVTHDIPADCEAVGVPARVTKTEITSFPEGRVKGSS